MRSFSFARVELASELLVVAQIFQARYVYQEKEMTMTNAEMIWQGRIHIGDEPGVYGDAEYSGLGTEFPFMIMSSSDDSGSGEVTIILGVTDINTFDPYPGHQVTIVGHLPVDPSNPNGPWMETELGQGRLKQSDTEVEIPIDLSDSGNSPFYISARVKVDTTVRPGLYDEFVVLRLSMLSDDHEYFASFGFQFP